MTRLSVDHPWLLRDVKVPLAAADLGLVLPETGARSPLTWVNVLECCFAV